MGRSDWYVVPCLLPKKDRSLFLVIIKLLFCYLLWHFYEYRFSIDVFYFTVMVFISLISWNIFPFLKNIWNSGLFWKIRPLSLIVFLLGKCIFKCSRRPQFQNFTELSLPTMGTLWFSLNILPLICPKSLWVRHWKVFLDTLISEWLSEWLNKTDIKIWAFSCTKK